MPVEEFEADNSITLRALLHSTTLLLKEPAAWTVLGNLLEMQNLGDPWVAQRFSATFSPGHDPGGLGSSPTSGSLHGACFSLCLCLCFSLSLSLYVSHE